MYFPGCAPGCRETDVLMGPSRRDFLATAAGSAALARGLPGAGQDAGNSWQLDGSAIAKRHQIVRTEPTANFLEGMLLGNGDVGVCITVRPGALGLHLGTSDSSDSRASGEPA